jgi:hypothetical protein
MELRVGVGGIDSGAEVCAGVGSGGGIKRGLQEARRRSGRVKNEIILFMS